MERLEKTWILELIGAALLTALLGLWGWTANRVVQVGESVVEVKGELQQEIAGVKAELQQEIAGVKAELQQEINGVRTELQREIAGVRTELGEVKAELQQEIAENGKKIAAMDAKLDLLISGLNISVPPGDNARIEPSGS